MLSMQTSLNASSQGRVAMDHCYSAFIDQLPFLRTASLTQSNYPLLFGLWRPLKSIPKSNVSSTFFWRLWKIQYFWLKGWPLSFKYPNFLSEHSHRFYEVAVFSVLGTRLAGGPLTSTDFHFQSLGQPATSLDPLLGFPSSLSVLVVPIPHQVGVFLEFQ